MLDKALNKLGGLFGLGGGQGDYYVAPKLESEAKTRLDEALKMGDDAKVQKLVQDIGGGKLSLSEIMSGAASTGNQDAALQSLASSPVAGSALASQQVMEDPLLVGMFGADSSLSRAVARDKELNSRGYSLQPEDYEAYGQASGNIARTFGKQENSLAQALASRGLAAGNSGAAVQSFSGMQGNKFEQLGQIQRQIADDRMADTRARVAENNQLMTGLGSLGQQAQGQRFNQNQQATQDQKNIYDLDINKYDSEQRAAQASQTSKEDNRQASLSDALGSGIMKGVEGGTSALLSSGASSLMPKAATPNKRNYVETDGPLKASR